MEYLDLSCLRVNIVERNGEKIVVENVLEVMNNYVSYDVDYWRYL